MTPENEAKLKAAALDINVDVVDSSNKRLDRINLLDLYGTPGRYRSQYDEEESYFLMKP